MNPNTSETSSGGFAAGAIGPDGGLGPAVRLALAVLRAYKLLVSPLFFAGSCRFLPTCSDYARAAVIRHGVVRGGWLAVKRLSRCHPLCEAGYDPVPGLTAGAAQSARDRR